MARLMFLDMCQYTQAFEALHSSGIDLIRQRPTPGDFLGSIYLGRQRPNWIWVPVDRLDDAEDALSRIDVSAQFPTLPVVGVKERACPWCDNPLTYPSDPRCPSCQRSFQWLDDPET